MSGLGRRRFIAIAASAAGMCAIPPLQARADAEDLTTDWRGLWLGGVATIRLVHPDRQRRAAILHEVAGEARRLERILSLYRPDSALVQLNQRGVLVAPPGELVDLLAFSNQIWRATGGLFDPTVQPLWQCYLDHFSSRTAGQGPPPASSIARALRSTGWPRVRVGRDRIALERGMAMTLNGVAQGYMTDRVIALLRAAGFSNCLVDMGEVRTLGRGPHGRPWQVAVRGPDARALALAPVETLDRAVATSAADGFAFDSGATCNHLFDPRTGRCAVPGRSLTVIAPTAAEADALSTAFALLDDARIGESLGAMPGVSVYAATAAGLHAIPAAT